LWLGDTICLGCGCWDKSLGFNDSTNVVEGLVTDRPLGGLPRGVPPRYCGSGVESSTATRNVT
jgi:hypothetical protein